MIKVSTSHVSSFVFFLFQTFLDMIKGQLSLWILYAYRIFRSVHIIFALVYHTLTSAKHRPLGM